MNAFALILFASPVLLLIVIFLFAAIVIGIRRGDRGDLTRHTGNHIEAISRRIAGVGIRNHVGSEEGDR
jgi:hypothetical protein